MLSFQQKMKVCIVILDTGFMGSPEDYVKQFYGKGFEELTENEAEFIIQGLENKPGCLVGTKEGGYEY